MLSSDMYKAGIDAIRLKRLTFSAAFDFKFDPFYPRKVENIKYWWPGKGLKAECRWSVILHCGISTFT